jgi:carbamoyl-phosphate synthase large subunit
MWVRKNILVLSAGRRVSLVRAFETAAAGTGAKVLTADLNPNFSAACRASTAAIILPPVLNPQYPDALATACMKYEVGLVVPTIDTELLVLAKLRPKLLASGTELIICGEKLVQAARDKRCTPKYFDAFGLQSPEIYSLDDIQFPAFAKPFDGSLSRNTFVVKSKADLTPALLATPNLIFSHYLDPVEHDEFTCDAYYDRLGNLICVVPRQRLEVRGGEISKGVTRRNEIVTLFNEKLANIPDARGCLTFQFFLHRQNRSAWLIELNPRFGGGFPMSYAAGANYPAWLVDEYLSGQKIEAFEAWEDGLLALRYDAEVIVRGK